jgi:hypothetical protein
MTSQRLTRSTTFRFNRLATARSFTNRCEKLMMIILGDDGLFWVVTPADATRLTRMGYELAD